MCAYMHHIRSLFYVWVGLCSGIRENIISHGHMVVKMKLNIVMKTVIVWGKSVFRVPGTGGSFQGQSRKIGTLGNSVIAMTIFD